ncbi:hypothetical protein HDU81_007486 [Chytriomyces hyalinus]|nr:hypothetical protein HDU81_007486 [Chytriomyces hyalinus]
MKGKRPGPGTEHAQSSGAPQIESANEITDEGAFSQAAGSSFVSVTGRNLWHKRKGRGRASNRTAADNSTRASNEPSMTPEILRASELSEASKPSAHIESHTNHSPTTPSMHQPTHQPTHDPSNDSSHNPKPTNESTHNVVKNAVSHWIRFTRVQIALRARNEKLKREALLKWRASRLMRWRQYIRATVQHRMATCLVFWRVWNMRIQIAKLDQANMDAAKSRANQTLVRTTLNYWLMYNDHRRIQNLKKRFALNSREPMLSTRGFKLWRDKFRFRRKIQLMDQQSIQFDSKRTLEHLSILKGWCIKAELFHDNLTAQRTFRHWKTRYHTSMHSKEALVLRPAVDHHKNHLLRQYLKEWVDFKKKEQSAKELERRAIEWDRKRILNSTFKQTLRKYTFNAIKRKMETLAHENWKFSVLEKLFQKWMDSCQERFRERLHAKKIERFRKQLLTRRYFEALAKNADIAFMERQKEQRAVIHHNRQTALKSLRAWKTFAHTNNERALSKRAAVRFSYLNLLQKAVTLGALLNWKKYVHERKIFREHVAQFAQSFNRRRIAAAFLVWKCKTCVAVQARKEQQEMEKQKDRNILRKVLQAWQIYTSERVVLKTQIDIRVSEIQSLLTAARVRRCFRQWIIYHDMMAAKALKTASADLFYVDSTRRKAFRVWKSRLSQSLTFKRNISIAEDHFNARLIKCSFGKWLQPKGVRVNWKTVYAARHITPVLHWSQTLSRSVLQAWRAHSKQEKQNYILLEQARGWKQELATRDGVMYWMLGVDVVRKVREGYQAAESFRTNQLELKKVKKFALRWRAKTVASKKAIRQHGGYG